MKKRSLIGRVVRKVNKMLHSDFQSIDSEKARRKKALAEGRRLKLKKNNYVFQCENLKPLFCIPLYQTDYIQQRILTEKNYYESENLDFICNEWEDGVVRKSIAGACFLDIGANIGNHTLYFFLECGAGKAYCFEPVFSTFRMLQKNIVLNGLEKKACLLNTAVGARKGTATISYYDEKNIGSTQIMLNGTGDIPVDTIDSMNIQEDIKLIKIDVEGFEVDVIEGCLETIAKNKPFIMIEIQEKNFDAIDSRLSMIGYQYIRINGINYFYFA